MRGLWVIAAIAAGCVDSTQPLLRPVFRDAGILAAPDAAAIARDASSPDSAPGVDARADAGFAADAFVVCEGGAVAPEPIVIEPSSPEEAPLLASDRTISPSSFSTILRSQGLAPRLEVMRRGSRHRRRCGWSASWQDSSG